MTLRLASPGTRRCCAARRSSTKVWRFHIDAWPHCRAETPFAGHLCHVAVVLVASSSRRGESGVWRAERRRSELSNDSASAAFWCDPAAMTREATMKYDLEGWFAGQAAVMSERYAAAVLGCSADRFQGQYRELVSCSNCTDFQSRALDIRYRPADSQDPTMSSFWDTPVWQSQDKQRPRHVHMLNSTLTASGRCLCCMLEAWPHLCTCAAFLACALCIGTNSIPLRGSIPDTRRSGAQNWGRRVCFSRDVVERASSRKRIRRTGLEQLLLGD